MPKQKKSAFKPPKNNKTTQDLIPILRVYDNGLFLEEGRVFSRLYSFTDTSFTIKPKSEQEIIMSQFEAALNGLSADSYIKICCVTLNADVQEKKLQVSAQATGHSDKVIPLVNAYNSLIDEVMSKSVTRTDKYLVISTEMTDKDFSVDTALAKLDADETVFSEFFRQNNSTFTRVTSEERLELLYNILNDNQKNYTFIHENGTVSIDWKKLTRSGMNFKDLIAPQYIEFRGSNFNINDKVAESLYINNMPNKASTEFYTSLSMLPFPSLVSYTVRPVSAKETTNKIKDLRLSNQTEAEGKNGPTRKTTKMEEELEAWEQDIQERDQRMFEFQLNVIHFAENQDELKHQRTYIDNIVDKRSFSIQPVIMRQERSFLTALPIGTFRANVSRYITTEALALFQPFDEASTCQKGGIYMGLNAINQNPIIINKFASDNYNSFILGAPGSGKSFSAKQEMLAVALLNPSADICILDPEGEYRNIVEALGGEVIRISPNNGVYMNPLDLDIDKSLDSTLDPLAMKTDFICGLIETMIGKNASLDAEQLSIVSKCLTIIYDSYLQVLSNLPKINGRPVTIDREHCPTLQTLMDTLLSQPEPMAQRIARVMDPYVAGVFSSFAHQTNVNTTSRIVCYDISGAGEKMLDIALKVCLNDMWNRTLANRRKSRVTYLYIDEAHKFLSNPTSASYFEQFWRRLRKWNGIPTAITQNASDLFMTSVAEVLLKTSANITVLKQSGTDQELLGRVFNLQQSELNYIDHPGKGGGLIISNGSVIPLKNEFPKDNPIYALLSSTDKSIEV